MKAAGVAAFENRRENRSGVYSYEQRPRELPEPYVSVMRKNKKATQFFDSQVPSYRRAAIWWVISAKQEETRLKRLMQLIEYSAKGQTLPQYTREKKK